MSKIIIADSGSTKTHWIIKEENKVVNEFYTQGLNPYFVSSSEITTILSDKITKSIAAKVSKVFFFGAGCNSESKNDVIYSALNQFFPNSINSVSSDLLGSAIALFSNNKGVACILGTGSNAALFDGNKFTNSIVSLGYVLGDEGSGNYMGKLLLKDYFQGNMPELLRTKFANKFNIEYTQVLNSIYKEPFPNKYLAQFTVFLSENRNHNYVENIIDKSFQAFVDLQLNTIDFNKTEIKIGFVGSIAFYFKDVLEKVLIRNAYNIGNVLKEPMEGLMKLK